MSELAAGSVFAGHRIEAVAGRGGMGIVYRATQIDLERTVAVKVIAPGLMDDPGARRRFVRESKVAASIDHPNVIPIYYAGEQDGVAYITMRYVSGADLRTLVRGAGPLAPARAAHVVAQVAAALDAAHAAGLVHRDVKPANILLDAEDHVYLSDFGLTKRAVTAEEATAPGHWVGTVDYVTPEQIRGKPVDARSDVYSLGCVLHFALTGRVPFPRDDEDSKLWAHLTDPPPRPSEHAPGLPEAFDAIIARALAKRPDERYPSAGDLGRAAVAAAAGRPVLERERAVATPRAVPSEDASTKDQSLVPSDAAPQATAPTAVIRRARPRRLAVIGVVAVAAIAIAVALAVGGGGDGSTPPAARTPARTSQPAAPSVAWKVSVGKRPNTIVARPDALWVTSFTRRRVYEVEPRAGRVAPGPVIGVGGQDLALLGNVVWIAVAERRTVLRMDARTGKLLGRPVKLPGQPISVDAAGRAVWVAELATVPRGPDHLVRIDPATSRPQLRVPVVGGIKHIRAAGGAVWVVSRRFEVVWKFRPRDGRLLGRIRVAADPQRVDYADDHVWVTNSRDDSVMRIDARTRDVVRIAVPSRPIGIAVHGRDVWVASYGSHTLVRLDARAARITGEPVAVGLNPYAVAVTDGSVYVSGVGDDTLTRVDY